MQALENQTFLLTPVVFPVCWLVIRRFHRACRKSDPESPARHKNGWGKACREWRWRKTVDGEKNWCGWETKRREERVSAHSFYFWRNKRKKRIKTLNSGTRHAAKTRAALLSLHVAMWFHMDGQDCSTHRLPPGLQITIDLETTQFTLDSVIGCV